MISSLWSRPDVKILISVFLPMMLIPLVFWDTTRAMMHVWSVNETFTHGYLIFPISAWLIWQNKPVLSQLDIQPIPWLFPVYLLLLALWAVFAAIDVQVAQQFIMITSINMAILMITGWRITKTILFPLLFLYFAVPFGESLIPPMMDLTAHFTVLLISLSGIPVYQDGLFFVLPTGNWSVVEECSGVRYLIASFALGSIYAYLNYKSTYKRAVFILFSLVLPVVGNVFRAYGIVMIGHLSGMKLATGVDHLVYGWVFFGVLIFALFYIGSFWRDEDVLSGNTASPAPSKKELTRPNRWGLWLFSSVAAAVIAVWLKVGMLQLAIPATPAEQLVLADHYGQWQSSDRTLNWQPYLTKPDFHVSRLFQSLDGGEVQIDIAYYFTQREGAEAVSSANRVSSPLGGDWKSVQSRTIQLEEHDFKETLLRHNQEDVLVWQWYQTGGYETSNPYLAKLSGALNLVLKQKHDAAMITLATIAGKESESARNRLSEFWKSAHADIRNRIRLLVKPEGGPES